MTKNSRQQTGERIAARENEVDVKLACGHLGRFHRASSTFDFPDDQVFCNVCDKLVHLDAGVITQVKGMNETMSAIGKPAPVRKQPTRMVKIEGNTLTFGRTRGHRMTITDDSATAGHFYIKCDSDAMFISPKDMRAIAKFLMQAAAAKEAK